jgi:protein-S-isoprenylcysteine O-methyltransferase Ste14
MQSSMLAVLAVVALFIRRRLVEDRMLLGGLAGYADYANRVRYRLVAGVF